MQRSSEKLQNLPYFWNHFGEDKNLKSAIKNSVGIFDVDGQSLIHGKFCWNISSSINLLFLIKFFLHDVSRTYLLLLHNSVNILYSTTLELVKLICVSTYHTTLFALISPIKKGQQINFSHQKFKWRKKTYTRHQTITA